MNEWSVAAFGDLYAIPSKNGIMAPARVRGEGFRLVNMKEIFAYDLIGTQAMELAPIPGRKPQDWLLAPGDLLFARQSLTLAGAGKVSFVETTPEPLTFESHIIRVRVDETRALGRFYYYLFRSSVGRDLLESIVEQVAAAGIRASDLARLRVPVPPLEEQQRVAGVLGALDDLIEANRQFAQQVRDLSSILYAKFAGEALGNVSLGQVASVSDRRIRPGKGSLRYIDIAALGDGYLEFPQPIDWSDAPSRARIGVEDGSTLWSTVRPNRRAHAFVVDAPDDLVASTGIAVLTPRGIGPAELFAACDRDEFVDQLVAMADGSAYPAVRPNAFRDVVIRDLGGSASDAFERVMWPLWRDVHAAVEEASRLARARDELLPLLMSGRVRVKEVA